MHISYLRDSKINLFRLAKYMFSTKGNESYTHNQIAKYMYIFRTEGLKTGPVLTLSHQANAYLPTKALKNWSCFNSIRSGQFTFTTKGLKN